MSEAEWLRCQDDVCPHILMVHKSERSAKFRAFCNFCQIKINIDGRLPDPILTDLNVLVNSQVRIFEGRFVNLQAHSYSMQTDHILGPCSTKQIPLLPKKL